MKQLTINKYFTKTIRTFKKTKGINIIQDSIQTDNITTSTNDYNNNQNHVDGNAVLTTLE